MPAAWAALLSEGVSPTYKTWSGFRSIRRRHSSRGSGLGLWSWVSSSSTAVSMYWSRPLPTMSIWYWARILEDTTAWRTPSCCNLSRVSTMPG